MINLEKKIEELTEKYGEPGKGAEGRYLHERKALYECCPPVLGVVTDNWDPEGLGRVRVSTDMSVPGSESPWLCVAGQWKKKGSGWWVLPAQALFPILTIGLPWFCWLLSAGKWYGNPSPTTRKAASREPGTPSV